MNKKVLIVGNSVKADALARKMSDINEVYITEKCNIEKTYAKNVDIRDDSAVELLDFVMEQNIDLTIVLSKKAQLSNIVKLFNSHNQNIFAPDREIAKNIYDKSLMKKMMYRLKIPTPKFGIFEKLNLVNDYIKNFEYPFVIKTNEPSSAVIVNSKKMAQNVLDAIFLKQNAQVLIENYVKGSAFSFYTVTDGYNALPISSALLFNRTDYNGQISSGYGACSPNYKLSEKKEQYIMDKVIYPVIENFACIGHSYTGIFGVEGIIQEDGAIQIISFNTSMRDSDSTAILNIIEDDLYEVFLSCITGAMSDDYRNIKQNNMASVSMVLTCSKDESENDILQKLKMLDEDILYNFYPNVNQNQFLKQKTNEKKSIILTSKCRTLTFASQKLYKEINYVFTDKDYHLLNNPFFN